MNQTCKVCGEPAAGFHFGAFTCEGCKSFFGRSYNNLSSISECKNNGECVINKKNRTACKACRLRKCLMVGMSKSGSRYGRRSNWFKIHCLLQEQQQQHQQGAPIQNGLKPPQKLSPFHHQPLNLGLLNPTLNPLAHHINKTKEELILLGLDEYKNSVSPSISSPESHNSDSSVEINDGRRMPFIHSLIHPSFLPPHNLLFPPGYPSLYPNLLQPLNNNNRLIRNHNAGMETVNKRILLDAVLQSQRSPTPEAEASSSLETSVQQDPIDLSMKTLSERGSSPTQSEYSGSVVTERGAGSDVDEDSECETKSSTLKRIKLVRPTPLDLTTKV